MYQFTYLPINLSVSLSIYLSICLSIDIVTYLHIHFIYIHAYENKPTFGS